MTQRLCVHVIAFLALCHPQHDSFANIQRLFQQLPVEIVFLRIYIYKTVMFDRVFALYWPCTYSGAVLRHPSGADENQRVPEALPGPPNSL